MTLESMKITSPVGELTLVANDVGLVAVLWENERVSRVKLPALQLNPQHSVLRKSHQQLREYFAGERTDFDLPFDPIGTEFQKKVWQTLREIPYGETRSYGQIAQRLKRVTAARAVGMANGRNPLSIVVPCHRVIGACGKLTGFAGGLPAKRYLLTLEGIKLRSEI
jgi:methylated-DNA-[protein]-cysteine S-methyltransferase